MLATMWVGVVVGAVLVDAGVLRVGVDCLLSPMGEGLGGDVARMSRFSAAVFRDGTAATGAGAVDRPERPLLPGVLSGDEITLRR